MRVVIVVVSFLWVFPIAYQALDIPFANALLIHGEPVNSNISSRRWKRAEKDNVTVTCDSYMYRPKKQNYCCNKCHIGFKVVKDCSGNGQLTQCSPCDIGTYTDIPNRSKFCAPCDNCLTQYGQITVSECAADKNTQCGCPAGQFKQPSGSSFICKECTKCENGTILLHCHDTIDTICQCNPTFFLDHSEKRCRHCSECQGPECKGPCPHTDGIQKGTKETEKILSVVFGVIMVVFIVGSMSACIVYIVFFRKQPSSKESLDNQQTTVLISQDESEKISTTQTALKNQTLPGYSPTVNLCVEQLLTNNSTDGSLPLPDITRGTALPCLSNPKLVYAIIENIPMSRWREFVRRLGLSNHAIESSEQDYRHYKDAQYAMLNAWITREGCPTGKRDQLFNVLREINLGACIEKIEEYL